MAEFYFETQKLSVGYNGVPLIRDIDLQIRRGEIVTLIGPNGLGKSTILKSITRQLKAVAGTVYIDGRNLHDFTQRELAQRMAVVLTERMRPELMTCWDVAATGRYPTKQACRSSVQALTTPHPETSSAPKPFSATMQHDGSGKIGRAHV